MIDWMIQVFRVLNRSQDKTLFQAVGILDGFFGASKEPISREDLHLFGVVSVFLSSKIEDVVPIFMNDIIRDASHGKFSKQQIIDAE